MDLYTSNKMEDNWTRLERNISSIKSESSDSDSESSMTSGISLKDHIYLKGGFHKSSFTSKKGEDRLPTRKPDPKIYNRNALMARENRQRKKAYLEKVEQELSESRNVNMKLVRAMKKQQKCLKRAEQERNYFKSVLRNRTDILKLLNILNSNFASFSPKSSFLPRVERRSASPIDSFSSTCRESRSSSYEPESLTTYDNVNSGSMTVEDLLKGSLPMSVFDFDFFTDYQPPSSITDTWNEILEEDFGLRCNSQNFPPSPTISSITEGALNVVDEHSYGALPDGTITNESEGMGVCLHITQGKVSLEFCPSCHRNSSRELPTQLLQKDAV